MTRIRALVSILTRPEGRVQPNDFSTLKTPSLFQSSPGPKAGCNVIDNDAAHLFWGVSILTRPEGRVQPR